MVATWNGRFTRDDAAVPGAKCAWVAQSNRNIGIGTLSDVTTSIVLDGCTWILTVACEHANSEDSLSLGDDIIIWQGEKPHIEGSTPEGTYFRVAGCDTKPTVTIGNCPPNPSSSSISADLSSSISSQLSLSSLSLSSSLSMQSLSSESISSLSEPSLDFGCDILIVKVLEGAPAGMAGKYYWNGDKWIRDIGGGKTFEIEYAVNSWILVERLNGVWVSQPGLATPSPPDVAPWDVTAWTGFVLWPGGVLNYCELINSSSSSGSLSYPSDLLIPSYDSWSACCPEMPPQELIPRNTTGVKKKKG